jgi:uncharacterized protein YukE
MTSPDVCVLGATNPSPLASFSHDWVGGDITGLSNLAATLYNYVPGIRDVKSTLDSQVDSIVGAGRWKGTAASSFEQAWGSDAEAANALSAVVEDAGEIVDGLAVALSRLESALEKSAARAQEHGVTIGPDGAPPEVCLAGTGSAQAKEAAEWLSWYQVQYQTATSDAQKVRSEAAADLQGLPVIGTGKDGGKGGTDPGWVQELDKLEGPAGYGDDAAGDAVGGAQGIGDATSEAAKMMRLGDSNSAKIMSALSRSDALQDLGSLGRSGAVEYGGDFLMGAGAVLTAVGVYQKTHNPYEAGVDAAGDTAISWADTESGAIIGGGIGSLIGPEGTVVGAGVGAIVGGVGSFFESNAFNDLMSDAFG